MQSTPESLYLVVGLIVKLKKKNIIGKLPDTAGRTGLLKFIQYWALENLLLSFWPSFHGKCCILGLNFSSDITSCVTLASCSTLLRLHLSTGPQGSPTKYTIYFSWMVLDALRFGFSNTVKWMTIFTFPCLSSVQFSHSIVSDSATPGLPDHHQLLESTQIHVHWVGDAISSSVVPFSSCLQSFPASGSFQMSQLFASGD